MTPRTRRSPELDPGRPGKAAPVSSHHLDLSSDIAGQAPIDPELYNELAHYPEAGPPLYVVRAIRFRDTGHGEAGETFVAESYRKTPYDPVLKDRTNLTWISALPSFGSDRVVRKIRFWQTVCEGAKGKAFPSAALAVTAALENQGAALKAFLDERIAEECGGSKPMASAWPRQRRLDASLPFAFTDSATAPTFNATGLDGKPTALLRRIGAWSFVRVANGQIEAAGDVDPGIFRDRAVLIGVTHADSRDIYATPLGSMPGVVILANSVALAKVITGTPEASTFVKNLLAITFFLIVAFLGIKLQAAPAMCLSVLWALALCFSSRSGSASPQGSK